MDDLEILIVILIILAAINMGCAFLNVPVWFSAGIYWGVVFLYWTKRKGGK